MSGPSKTGDLAPSRNDSRSRATKISPAFAPIPLTLHFSQLRLRRRCLVSLVDEFSPELSVNGDLRMLWVWSSHACTFGHIRRINVMLGLFVPAIVTPLELLGGRDDSGSE